MDTYKSFAFNGEFFCLEEFNVAMDHDYRDSLDDMCFSPLPVGERVYIIIKEGKRLIKRYDRIDIDQIDVKGEYHLDAIQGQDITVIDCFVADGKAVYHETLSCRLDKVSTLPFKCRQIMSVDELRQNKIIGDVLFSDRRSEYNLTYVINKAPKVVVYADQSFFSLYDMTYDPIYENKNVLYDVLTRQIEEVTNLPATSYNNLSRSLDNDRANLNEFYSHVNEKATQVSYFLPLTLDRFLTLVREYYGNSPFYIDLVNLIKGRPAMLSLFERSRSLGLEDVEALSRQGIPATYINLTAFSVYSQIYSKPVGKTSSSYNDAYMEKLIEDALCAKEGYVFSNYIPVDLRESNYRDVLDRGCLLALEDIQNPLIVFVKDCSVIVCDSNDVLFRYTKPSGVSSFSLLVAKRIGDSNRHCYSIVDCLFSRDKDIRCRKLTDRLISRDSIVCNELQGIPNFISMTFFSLRSFNSFSKQSQIYFYPDSKLDYAKYKYYEWNDKESLVDYAISHLPPSLINYIRTHPKVVAIMHECVLDAEEDLNKVFSKRSVPMNGKTVLLYDTVKKYEHNPSTNTLTYGVIFKYIYKDESVPILDLLSLQRINN